MARKPGFGTVTKRPNGRYTVRYSVNGVRQPAPGISFATERQARQWLATRQTDIIRGHFDPNASATPDTQTFHEYALGWLKTGKRKPSTLQQYSDHLDRLILPTFKDKPMDRITPADVRQWHQNLTCGERSKSQAYTLLKTIFNQAVRDEVAERNPCTIRGAASANPKPKDTMTRDEVDAIAEASTHYELLILTAAWTGLRLGELSALTREDLTRRPGQPLTITVNKTAYDTTEGRIVGPPKTRAGNREVTVPDGIAALLTEHLRTVKPGGLVFTSTRGEPLTRNAVATMFRKAVATAGTRRFTFHDLRHFAGTTLAPMATISESMARLGHSSPAMATRYAHATREREQQLAEALDAIERRHA
jgi:integrase